MTTLTHQRPSLEARTLAASMVVVGTVEAGPISQVDYNTEPSQVHSRFQVAVDEVLSGRPAGPAVTVRVVGGQVEDRQTEWTSVMREGDRVLLFLSPYCGADRDQDEYVPYFGGCYPVSSEGVVELGAHGLREAYAQATERPETLNVDAMRSFVQAALLKRDQANARLPEREPDEPDVSESGLNAMLHVEPGGARWAALDDGEQTRRSGG